MIIWSLNGRPRPRIAKLKQCHCVILVINVFSSKFNTTNWIILQTPTKFNYNQYNTFRDKSKKNENRFKKNKFLTDLLTDKNLSLSLQDRCRQSHSLAQHNCFPIHSFSHLSSCSPLEIFQKKKCVSIDAKCSETYRNEKKICLMSGISLCRRI